MKKTIIGVVLSLFFVTSSHAQHDEILNVDNGSIHEDGGFKIAAVIGHTYINSGGPEGNLYIPSWGLDVDFWFSHKWGIGLHNDVEIENFVVEKDEAEFIERVNPLVFTLDVLYNFGQGFILSIGPGLELEQNESFTLVRAGLEYEYDMNKELYLMPTLYYDQRFDGYSTTSFGLGIGYKL